MQLTSTLKGPPEAEGIAISLLAPSWSLGGHFSTKRLEKTRLVGGQQAWSPLRDIA